MRFLVDLELFHNCVELIYYLKHIDKQLLTLCINYIIIIIIIIISIVIIV